MFIDVNAIEDPILKVSAPESSTLGAIAKVKTTGVK